MSEALYGFGGLRFWTEREILLRDQAVQTLHQAISGALLAMNQGWAFHRVEGPLLTPRKFISEAYTEDDIFLLQAKLGEDEAAMRAETTASSYLYAEHILKTTRFKLPLCVWQVGKSFRRETQDGARWGTLRLNEFYQAEWQCVYAEGTMADYRAAVEPAVGEAIRKITGTPEYRIVASDRLPAYSRETRDVEVPFGQSWKSDAQDVGAVTTWKEMCSISTRTDFPQPSDPNQKRRVVLEIAVGLDRLVAVEGWDRGS
jgi:glycyl-tRNA synthetase